MQKKRTPRVCSLLKVLLSCPLLRIEPVLQFLTHVGRWCRKGGGRGEGAGQVTGSGYSVHGVGKRLGNDNVWLRTSDRAGAQLPPQVGEFAKQPALSERSGVGGGGGTVRGVAVVGGQQAPGPSRWSGLWASSCRSRQQRASVLSVSYKH